MKKTACFALATAFAMTGCGGDDPAAPNNAPRITAGPGAAQSVIYDSDTTIISVTAADADGDELTYVWTSDDGAISGDGAIVAYSPDPVSEQSEHTVAVTVSDGNGGTAEGSFAVTVRPSVVIGATYRVRLEGLEFQQTGCDGFFDDDIEAFWNIRANDVTAVRSENDYVPASFGTYEQIQTEWTEADILFDGTGMITIAGTVSDYDDLSANDVVGIWDLVYDTGTIEVGSFSVNGGGPDGPECRVVLDFTIEKVADLRGAP